MFHFDCRVIVVKLKPWIVSLFERMFLALRREYLNKVNRRKKTILYFCENPMLYI